MCFTDVSHAGRTLQLCYICITRRRQRITQLNISLLRRLKTIKVKTDLDRPQWGGMFERTVPVYLVGRENADLSGACLESRDHLLPCDLHRRKGAYDRRLNWS